MPDRSAPDPSPAPTGTADLHGAERPLVGGQAIFEGVMVRCGPQWGAAARLEDGHIVTTTGRSSERTGWVWRVQILRGCLATVESVRIGLRATRWSLDVSRTDEPPPSWRERVTATVVLVAVLAVFLLVPGFAATLGPRWSHGLIEGVVRVVLFVGYLVLLGANRSIRRTFEYHAAEHMAVSSWEATGRIDRADAVRRSKHHPRCGTELLVLVVLISVVAFSVLPPVTAVWGVVLRFVLLPVIAGAAFELTTLAGRAAHPIVRRTLAAPGLLVQRLTTREPTDDQLEVALAALTTIVGTRD